MSKQPADRLHPAIEYIDTPAALTAFCNALRDSEWIALDTEFIREKTYFPRLCLVQVGVPERCACIDPLALDSLQPLYELLFDTGITKVMHACSQDQEIFVHLTGRVPTPVFDTQLAVPLLGLPEQTGYANFIREMLGVTLDKAQSRTDWSRRPLSAAQIEYAADDVRYLSSAYPLVRQRLAEQGRLDWLKAEFEPCEQLERYQPDPVTAWQRLRGLEKLKPKALAIAQQLAAWREQQAIARDLPRNWILKDEVIVDIARLAPQQPAALADIRSLPARTVERYGQTLVEQVAIGAGTPPQPLAVRGRRAKPDVQEEALADILQAQLRLLADALDINSTSIAGRKDLLALIRDERTPLLKGWRRVIAGEELLALRDGQRRIAVSGRRVEIEHQPSQI
jgi:ribonuclease D